MNKKSVPKRLSAQQVLDLLTKEVDNLDCGGYEGLELRVYDPQFNADMDSYVVPVSARGQHLGHLGCALAGSYWYSGIFQALCPYQVRWPVVGEAPTFQRALDCLLSKAQGFINKGELEPATKPVAAQVPSELELSREATLLLSGLRGLKIPQGLKVQVALFHSEHSSEVVVFEQTKKNNLRRVGAITVDLREPEFPFQFFLERSPCVEYQEATFEKAFRALISNL